MDRVGRMRSVAAIIVLAMSGAAGCTARPTASVPPAQTAGPPGVPVPATLTVLGAGDILLHPPLWEQARQDGGGTFDFTSIFANTRARISGADLAVCHLETPLAPPGGPFSGYPQFNVPPQIATAIKQSGFDTCSTASNHTLDADAAGVFRTLDVLDAAGLHHAGSYRTAGAAPNIINVKGTRVAQLSYTFGFNGLSRPPGQEWIANLIDPAAIIAEARQARANGAEIVVLSLHWGTEYEHGASDDQVRLARELLAAPDIDLILGCHAHVVQPFEKIGDKWVVYGMGNEVARHEDPIDSTREGVMPRFTFTRVTPGHWRVTAAEAIPTWVELSPAIRILDLPAAHGDGQDGDRRAAGQRIRGYLGARGAEADGLRIVEPGAS